MPNKKKEIVKLKEEDLEKVNGSMKIFVRDIDPEELSWWEKILKVFFKKK